MPNIKHILFPVDFSEQCAKTAPFVQAWAANFDARVTLLNILELPCAYYTDSSAYIAAVNIDSLLRERKKRLDAFASGCFCGPEDQRMAMQGLTSAAILEFAKHERVSLIMMPTRGYGPFRRLLLGSVTAKVLHDSAVPVWTAVHAEQPATSWTPPECSRILCAIDLSPKSINVIRWAKWLSDSYGARLLLVHAVTGWPPSNEFPQSDEFCDLIFNSARKEIEKLQQQADTDAEVRMEGGEIAHVVQRTALDFKSDLVVIGRGVLQGTLGRLRTHAYELIRESPCPVLSV